MSSLIFFATLAIFMLGNLLENTVSGSPHYKICNYGTQCITDSALELELLDNRCKEHPAHQSCRGPTYRFQKKEKCTDFNEENGYAEKIICKCENAKRELQLLELGCEFIAENMRREFYERSPSYDILDANVVEQVLKNSAVLDLRTRSKNPSVSKVLKTPCLLIPEGESAKLGYQYMYCQTFQNLECDF